MPVDPPRSTGSPTGSNILREQTRKEAVRRTLSTVSTFDRRGSLTNWSPFSSKSSENTSSHEYPESNTASALYGRNYLSRNLRVELTNIGSGRTIESQMSSPDLLPADHVPSRDYFQRPTEEGLRNRHISLRMFDQKAPNDAWPAYWNRFPSPSETYNPKASTRYVSSDGIRGEPKALHSDPYRTLSARDSQFDSRGLSPQSAGDNLNSPETYSHSLGSSDTFESPFSPSRPLATSDVDEDDLTQKFRRQSLHTGTEHDNHPDSFFQSTQYTKFRATDGYIYNEPQQKAKPKSRTVARINVDNGRSNGDKSPDGHTSVNAQTGHNHTKETRDKDEWLKFAKSRQGSDGSVLFKCQWVDEEGKHCGYYGKRHLVKRHVETRHLQIRDHICPYCSKAFAQKTALHIHVNRHTGEKPHPCKFNCGMWFNDPARKHKHQIEVHNYEAKAPPKRFTRPGQYSSPDEAFYSESSDEYASMDI